MTEQYVYTGVAATATEESTMRSPRLVMGFGPFSPAPSYQARIHACALTHGLPEIPGFYGYDFERHEFIRMPFEVQT
jgi:hypothetical protein